MQWNCRGAANKRTDLNNVSTDFDILLLCETYLKPEKTFAINKNSNITRSDSSSNNRGGLMIAIIKEIVFSKIPSILNIENSLKFLSISVNASVGQLLIVSAYRVPVASRGVFENTWRRFLETVTFINPNNVLIAGYFNLNHYLWVSDRACQNGISFCAALDDSDSIFLNNGKSTFVNRAN